MMDSILECQRLSILYQSTLGMESVRPVGPLWLAVGQWVQYEEVQWLDLGDSFCTLRSARHNLSIRPLITLLGPFIRAFAIVLVSPCCDLRI